MCRTYGAQNYDCRRSQPFRAGLRSFAPPALIRELRPTYQNQSRQGLSARSAAQCSPAWNRWGNGKVELRAP
jgi:hypothetical protein